MTGLLTILVLVTSFALALLAAVRYLRGQAAGDPDVIGAGVVEVAVLAYLVARVVDLAGGHRTSGLGLVIGYLVGIALVMPVAVLLALAERTKWGSVVLGVGALTVCVLLARIHQLWTPVHG